MHIISIASFIARQSPPPTAPAKKRVEVLEKRVLLRFFSVSEAIPSIHPSSSSIPALNSRALAWFSSASPPLACSWSCSCLSLWWRRCPPAPHHQSPSTLPFRSLINSQRLSAPALSHKSTVDALAACSMTAMRRKETRRASTASVRWQLTIPPLSVSMSKTFLHTTTTGCGRRTRKIQPSSKTWQLRRSPSTCTSAAQTAGKHLLPPPILLVINLPLTLW